MTGPWATESVKKAQDGRSEISNRNKRGRKGSGCAIWSCTSFGVKGPVSFQNDLKVHMRACICEMGRMHDGCRVHRLDRYGWPLETLADGLTYPYRLTTAVSPCGFSHFFQVRICYRHLQQQHTRIINQIRRWIVPGAVAANRGEDCTCNWPVAFAALSKVTAAIPHRIGPLGMDVCQSVCWKALKASSGMRRSPTAILFQSNLILPIHRAGTNLGPPLYLSLNIRST